MKTIMANKATVEKKWYIIDGEGKALGRVAAEAAKLLRGKHKATFTPNVDCGDNVIILNSDKIVLTGKKEEQKYFKRYSGYRNGLKEIQNCRKFNLLVIIKIISRKRKSVLVF